VRRTVGLRERGAGGAATRDVGAINPSIPAEAIDGAVRTLTRAESPRLAAGNRRFHRFVADGVPVGYPGPDGRIVHDQVWLVHWAEPEANDWLAVQP